MQKHDPHTDELFMQRALDLALLGRGNVSPNPLVGCVIVHSGKIIGEGWHQKYGEAHAEVNAINNVVDTTLLPESTVYVTLEPCSHFGKTPPCADMLIRNKVKKVVVCNVDPNPLVAGQGINKLRAAGIEVDIGTLTDQGLELNKRFFTYINKQRPFIILKWAETSDGFIARENFDSKWISNATSRRLVHRWRAEEDAVLVGSRTAQQDDPQLNVRDWTGRNPVRVVIDRYLKLSPTLHLFDGSQQTICYNTLRDESENNISFIRLDEHDFVHNIARDLFRQKIQSVIVEGGTATLNMFLAADLWDECKVFVSPQTFGKGIASPLVSAGLVSEENIDGDLLRTFRKG